MRGRRVLVADDDSAMRTLLREVLESQGARVDEATSGWELLLRVSSNPPYDLVVSDLRMPMPDGITAVTMIRAIGIETPFILMTAFGDDRTEQRLRSVSHAAMLAKPFPMSDLLAGARRMLAEQQVDAGQRARVPRT